MPYINPDIAQIDWDDLIGWTDLDNNGSVSSIDPAGQLYLDCRAMTGNGRAYRNKDIGTIGSGNYYVEIRFKGDAWDGYDDTFNRGIYFDIEAGISHIWPIIIANDFVGGDGIMLQGAGGFVQVATKTWDNNWHTIVLYIHNSQTDMDIWIDKSPNEAADVTDADCDVSTTTDGSIKVIGRGTVDGNGEYHIDYLYIGTELAAIDYTLVVTVGAFVLTGIATALLRGIMMIVSVGTFTLTGIATILRKGYILVVSVGNFILTGIATTFTKTLNMAVTVGSFTLTGINVILKKGLTMAVAVGQFILTGISVVLKKVGWVLLTKNTTNFTEQSKNTTTFSEQSKSSTNWTEQNKS